MKKILLALCLFVASFSAFAALTPAQQKLLATGSGTTVSPSLLGHEGSISYQDVELARNSQ